MTTNSEFLFSGGGAYQIERSVRFNSADSAYLSRTPSVAGNRKTWTWSGWFKKVQVSGTYWDWLFDTSVNSGFILNYDTTFADSQFVFYDDNGAVLVKYAGAFRDTSAWYHLQLVYDSTQATDTERIRVYVNGNRLSVDSATWPGLNADSSFNNNIAHSIGRWTSGSSRYLNGYLADIHFIDGQALDPTSFGEFDTNGVWQPKAYTGTYGTNGFHLPFSDNSTAAALGTDTSGNSNTWTVNNLSVAAGAGNDSLVDTPTNYGTDTGVGGEVRGNYATLNPLDIGNNTSISNGNLDVTLGASSGGWRTTKTTISVSSGKWYVEVTAGTLFSSLSASVGVVNVTRDAKYIYTSFFSDGYMYICDGGIANNNALIRTESSWTTNDVVGIALDLDSSTIRFYKNGVAQGAAITVASNISYAFTAGGVNISNTLFCNFGQRPFAYAAPTGFKALCTQNLPDPTIADGSTAMDVVLYAGNGSTQTISGLGFESDLLWIKRRDGANSHQLVDSVRGLTKYLFSDATLAEETRADQVTATSSTGFSLGSNAAVNTSAASYVAWTWDAGSSTVTNTDGSITSQVRANPSAGFSVVGYTGTGANGTVGHGLGVAPGFLIVKNRTSAGTSWVCWHSALAGTERIDLNGTNAKYTDTTAWNSTVPSSAVFSVGTAGLNTSGNAIIAYCFAPVAGYSAFGSYTGNGSADGPFVYTGMRPAFVMIKYSSGTANWVMYDNKRGAINLNSKKLAANLSDEENNGANLGDDTFGIDFLSNGFKIRTIGANHNVSSGTYIYAAFSENPFKTARAR